MPKYFVANTPLGGVYRPGVGLFKPGSVLELPDAASKPGDLPPRHLFPADPEAQAVLREAYGIERPIVDATPPAPKDETMTLRQYAEGYGLQSPAKGRAADR